MTLLQALDLVLAAGVLFFALRTVVARGAAQAVSAFIGLGLVTALAWARLRAPDVALAEAAIGAGLTGALLLRHLALTRADGGR